MHIEGQGSQRGCERSSKEKRQLTRCPFRAEGRERTRGLTNGWALAGVSCLKTTRASHTIPGAGRPPGSAGEGATAVPRVSLAVNRMSRDIPTLPSVLTSSHGGFATSSHQACSGFSSLRSLRGDDAAGRGVGDGRDDGASGKVDRAQSAAHGSGVRATAFSQFAVRMLQLREHRLQRERAHRPLFFFDAV
jgi:hypothetical protein